jgi:H+/Cl- antiporter ClcA
MHTLAGRKKWRVASSRALIVAGSGAGIAAAFNTPLGGIMFSIEEMCRHRAFQANSTTLTAVIFAGLMSLGVLGSYTYFGQTRAVLGWPDGIWPVLMCGGVGGLIGGLFGRLLIASSRGLPGRIGEFAAQRPIAFAAACGLATAVIGLSTGGMTYGTGYAESKAALEGSGELPLYFVFAKMLVVWLAFLSRIPGGIFAPALAVGAGLGADIAYFLPEAQSSAILVLGMVAFLAAMTQAPITSFVIVMEMTANHEMLMPLMATAVIAYGFSKSVCPIPIYHALCHSALRRAADEVRLEDGKEPVEPPPSPPEPAQETPAEEPAALTSGLTEPMETSSGQTDHSDVSPTTPDPK